MDQPTILYEDNHILVLDKPAGIPTQGEGSLEEQARLFIKKRDKKPGNAFVYAVHRIDKPVAGIVLFAKSKKALSRLSEQVRKGEHEKKYRALIEGNIEPPSGVLVDQIEKKEHRAVVSPAGKRSELSYTVREKYVEIRLHTGRYHQIRVQFGSRGHPIYGDVKYGSTHSYPNGIALIHAELEIFHPITKEKIKFQTKNKLLSV